MKKILLIGILFLSCIGLFLYLNKEEEKNLSIDINYEKTVNTDNLTQQEISSDYQITEEGIYELTGNIDTTVFINTEGTVKLILNNVHINSSNGPAIYVENAQDVVIYLEENSENYVTDGTSYDLKDSEINGAIYSKDDLIFEGEGTLTVTSNYEDAIVSKDDVIFHSGNYIIQAKDDGIRGKDSVVIYDGVYQIIASGDGIKATNDTEDDKGYIVIKNGEFNIISTLDGIQSKTSLLIKNGNFNIETGGGSNNASTSSNWGMWKGSTSTEKESAKALKAGSNIQIDNGNFVINSSDDAIHSNGNILINNGSYTISSGDDGIHADNILQIENGMIDIKKSYEGIEASQIILNGANISVVSSDDGINSSGGSDSSSMNRPGANQFASDGSMIEINGGTIYVNATGDGIDSNGDIIMTGGTLIVNGPTDNGNGAIDKNGTFTITGGTLVASGSSGMAEMPDKGQNSVMIYFSNTISSDNIVSIYNENDEIITYQASKNYNNLVISSPNLKTNETYTIYTNGTSNSGNMNGLYDVGGYSDGSTYTTFTISSTTTKVGNNNSMQGGMNGGGMTPGRR